MRTDTENVFAIGDCALKRDFFTRKAASVWLASTATAEARNVGTNIDGIRVLHQIQGTIAAFSTKIGGVSFASPGTIHHCIFITAGVYKKMKTVLTVGFLFS